VQRPADGWSEQDPASWITAIENTLSDLHQNHASSMQAVKGIGLSGHMHGATLLDNSDSVIRACILWNDTRSHQEAASLDTNTSRDLCGNILFPGFTAPKLAWVANNEPELFNKVSKVLLPKDYARLWLTGEHVSEMSDAAGTGWLDVEKRNWSDELLNATSMSGDHMPSLVEGTDVSGQLRQELCTRFGLPNNVVVAGGAGDNAASACGMGVVAANSAFLSLGTSGVLFAANAKYQPNAASALGQSPSELSSALTESDTDATNVIFLPYLGGERTPHNDANARGVFLGLSHTTDAKAMTKAVLQGVAFAFKDSQSALATAGTQLQNVFAIGGGSKSNYWLQILANTLNIPLQVTVDGDYGASLGAARLGMIAADKADPLSICTPPTLMRSMISMNAIREVISR